MPLFQKPDKIWLSYMLYAVPSVFDHFEGIEELLSEDIIDEFYLTKTKGAKIGGEMSSGNRIGSFLMCGKDIQELDEKNRIVQDALEAYDSRGLPILRKDLLQVAL